ncbi:hypothetical protein [Stomatohabitans albus]|uniref:hypothetical protein n=1 Tax=Stomatohabitans albus TaxID=3110766 RepID=UPI00300D8EBF
MATGEHDLTRDVLNRAMDLYGRDQVAGDTHQDLNISDVRDIADQLGVPQHYVSEALAQPMIRPPATRRASTYVAERYVSHPANEVLAGAVTYLRRREGFVPDYSVPYGYRLKKATGLELLDLINETETTLADFKYLDVTIQSIDDETSVLRIQTTVMPANTAIGLGALGGAIAGGVIGWFAGLVATDSGALTAGMTAVGIIMGTGIGVPVGLYWWKYQITSYGEVLTRAICGAGDVIDNPLPEPVSPTQQLAEGAGKIIGAFVRGLSHKKPDA